MARRSSGTTFSSSHPVTPLPREKYTSGIPGLAGDSTRTAKGNTSALFSDAQNTDSFIKNNDLALT
jgi:hypothetical protein